MKTTRANAKASPSLLLRLMIQR